METTINYELFKPLKGNRPISEVHVRRLMESFKRDYLMARILVNEHFEVIDGQHRLEAAKRLSLPVEYEVRKGFGLEEAQALNQNVKNWGKMEFLNSYCDMGLLPYLQLREFMQTYPDFGIAAAEAIFTNTVGGVNNSQEIFHKGKAIGKVKKFEKGELKVNDLPYAYEIASKIMDYKKFFSGFNRVVFVGVMIGLFKNPKFNHELMIKRLQSQPTALVLCANAEQYRLLIEKIYNFRTHNKVNLRY
jgi:hypothetical protein